jgi:hypothetical protein
MDMTPQEELQLALAEVEKAKAELDAAKADIAAADSNAAKKPAAKKAVARPKRPAREVHKSDLTSECYGYGGAQPTSIIGARRTDMQPVVTKELNPMDRPVSDRMPRKVSVRVYDDAGVQQGLAMTMMEREADKLEASLPIGWSITSRRIK